MQKIRFNEHKNIISKQLKIARMKAGYSQTQLAAKMQLWNINLDQQMVRVYPDHCQNDGWRLFFRPASLKSLACRETGGGILPRGDEKIARPRHTDNDPDRP